MSACSAKTNPHKHLVVLDRPWLKIGNDRHTWRCASACLSCGMLTPPGRSEWQPHPPLGTPGVAGLLWRLCCGHVRQCHGRGPQNFGDYDSWGQSNGTAGMLSDSRLAEDMKKTRSSNAKFRVRRHFMAIKISNTNAAARQEGSSIRSQAIANCKRLQALLNKMRGNRCSRILQPMHSSRSSLTLREHSSLDLLLRRLNDGLNQPSGSSTPRMLQEQPCCGWQPSSVAPQQETC